VTYQCYYDPSNPSSVVMDRSYTYSMIILVGIIAFFIFLCFVMILRECYYWKISKGTCRGPHNYLGEIFIRGHVHESDHHNLEEKQAREFDLHQRREDAINRMRIQQQAKDKNNEDVAYGYVKADSNVSNVSNVNSVSFHGVLAPSAKSSPVEPSPVEPETGSANSGSGTGNGTGEGEIEGEQIEGH